MHLRCPWSKLKKEQVKAPEPDHSIGEIRDRLEQILRLTHKRELYDLKVNAKLDLLIQLLRMHLEVSTLILQGLTDQDGERG